MNRAILTLVIAVAAAACGSGPQTAGPLTTSTTLAPSTTQTTAPAASSTTTVPDSVPDGSSTTTTAPSQGDGDGAGDGAGDGDGDGDGVGTGSTTITVYFLDSEGVAVPVERTVTTPRVAEAAMEAIIDGPTDSERAAGLSSAMPADALLLGLTVADGTATVDLSQEAEAGGGSLAVLGRLAQVVYTLTDFATVDSVQLLLDGERVDYFSGEGVLIADPLTADDFLGAIPIGEPVGGGTVTVWEDEELPPAPVGGSDTRLVVLVAEDDTLNVRSGPGVDAEVIGEFRPGAAVVLAGDSSQVGSSTWVTVATPAGPGWVNSFYLTPSIPEGALSGDRERAVVDELADRFAAGEDFSDLVSERGLWVAHHATPIRFRQSELNGILDSTETYRWGSNALEPDSPEIQPRTFSEAIAGRFVDAHDDADARIVPGEHIEGPNGRPVQYALPTEFEGFPFVTVHDPGDEAQYDGLDWIGWIVSLALEDGELKVVGLTIDEWAP